MIKYCNEFSGIEFEGQKKYLSPWLLEKALCILFGTKLDVMKKTTPTSMIICNADLEIKKKVNRITYQVNFPL